MDVAQGSIDPTLQPALAGAFTHALASPDVNAHDFAYITPELLAAVTPAWPYTPDAWTTADGGMSAASLAIASLTRQGRAVAVEQPTSQRTIALLRNGRRRPVGVPWDLDGPVPDALKDAVAHREASVFYWSAPHPLPDRSHRHPAACGNSPLSSPHGPAQTAFLSV
ncbi:hypothetical protein [Kineosporia corallincola]|uniref:hypothetical protein n=1 Tax=Kineosporia corallincola TaxID=2835133 RepID=UPI001FE3FD5C|nr:hypothetical protein [Kineosporia corallincola]